jgi:RimJ/RimL family protein N-acetyltransferase
MEWIASQVSERVKKINTRLFQGELVRLVYEDPEVMAKSFNRWDRDSEYMRLLDSDPPIMWSENKIKELIEKDTEKDQNTEFFFPIRTLEDNYLIGFVGLFGVSWNHGEAWVGIGLGDRNYWGNGYGTDAMRVILRYAFHELNLHRVSLGVFEYNQRARRSYEKVGFSIEGRVRGDLLRQGQRWDVFIMGILREEWLKQDKTLAQKGSG